MKIIVELDTDDMDVVDGITEAIQGVLALVPTSSVVMTAPSDEVQFLPRD